MDSRRILPLLLVLFVGSGCAALIYEVVWYQLLQLVIGSSAVSLAVVLGTFMGGMCLGSLLLPRLVDPRRDPLRVYAALELGIGAIAVLVLFGMPLVAGAYAAWAGTGQAGIVLRGLAAALCLLPPTFLMGATLPAVSRRVEATQEGMSWLGFFYAGNTAGAVAGSLLAGFYLLRVFDVTSATLVAVALNVAVAAAAFLLSKASVHEVSAPVRQKGRRAPGSATVYFVIAISGMTALAAEVLWTRLLSLLIGGTVYTFSLLLAVFLLGLGLGSSGGAALAARVKSPRVTLGWCQVLLCAAIAWTAYMLTVSLPFWPVNPSITADVWLNFQLDLVRSLWALLPPALLWGASFPLALAAVAARGQDPGRLVGGVYASNTVGAIVGSLGAVALVAWIGSQHAQQVLIVLSAVAGILSLSPVPAEEPASRAGGFLRGAGFVAAIVVVGVLVRTVSPVPGMLVAYGRYAPTWLGLSEVFYVGEGVNSSVAVSRRPNGVLNYHNAGKVQASSEPQDMRLQRMLGHLTTLVPENPRKVLVIGCGAGVTAGAASIDPKVQELTIAEIEPLVPRVVSTHFGDHNFRVIENPKVRVQIDDARHYLFVKKERYDAITSDPLDPWVKGAAMLYTSEFFELVKSRLNPGGVFTLFVQLYETNTEAVKSEVGTFLQAFPNGVAFGNTQNGQGYDMVLVGQVEPMRIDLDKVDERLSRPEYAPVARSLAEVGFYSAVDLFATYAGGAVDLAPWLKDASINRDRNLRLQYLAGRGLNLYRSGEIYADMTSYARYPQHLFTGSDEKLQALKVAIQQALGHGVE
ncbi:MAG: fused MFS/spermidine synthase [Vicinamibacterales bacterium]